MEQQPEHSNDPWPRRKFVSMLTKAVGSGIFLSAPFVSNAFTGPKKKDWTVGDIMELFIKQVPGATFSNTVDTLKAGSRNTRVTGIVTTMFPTIEIITKTIAVGANFIIAHEPTFYNHLDETNWLENDDVYQYKADLLKKHNIAIWRNHDYAHAYRPDSVQSAVVTQLGWQKFQDKEYGSRIVVPAMSLQLLIQHIKKSLHIHTVRYIGDLNQSCKKILLMPGAYGGRRHIEAIGKEQPDVAVVGEIQEWETAEYVRDARAKGKKLSLVIMGHASSEEPGSAFMATWLQQNVPGVAVKHIPSGNPLSFL